MKSSSFFITLAGLSGAVTIGMASFVAHGLEAVISNRMIEVLQTGIRYQMYHTLAILVAAALSSQPSFSTRMNRACWAWTIGIVLFSGSLYLLVLTDMRQLGMITPFGGVAFIIGWLMLIPWRGRTPENSTMK